MRDMRDWMRQYRAGWVSRRNFIEAAAAAGMSLTSTATALAQADRGRTVAKNYNQTNLNPYEEWRKTEGIPVYGDYYIADVRTVKVAPWKRLGVLGAYIDLKGGEGVNDGYICEIPPGGRTIPQHYLFEEILYVVAGEGESLIWNKDGPKQTVKWKAGSVLGPPLNTWRQHVNLGATPVRIMAMTNAPVLIDLFHSADFVFNNDHVFADRYNGDPDAFGTDGSHLHHKETTSEESEQAGGVYTWESSFVPNARTLGLFASKERGEGNSRIELQMADNTMQAHISEFEVGTYKKAHRHGPGSHVVMLNGHGFTLMWKGAMMYSEATTQVRVDWAEGSLFVPPDGWFHQHFNTGGDPARYLAATWGGDGKWFMRSLGGGGRTHRLGKTSTRVGGNLIEYADEDPAIREMFIAELAKSGVPLRMSSKKGKKS